MGKENELWDDSALLDAFENAMSKYKKMHGKKNSEANVSVVVNQSADETIKEAGDISIAPVNTERETEAAKDIEPANENDTVKLQTAEPLPYIDSSTSMQMQYNQDGNYGYLDSQGTQDYNQLLSQYYEVEEKRQMILQQLQKFSNWNYQYSAEGSSTAAQWGTSCASQEYPISTNQASQSTVACSCCPYACQYLATPCASYPCCSLAGTSACKLSTEPNGAMNGGKLPTDINSNIVKIAMGAAERAISSTTAKASVNPDINDEIKEKKDGEEEMNQSTSSETDLTVLLNAWYSAGFHTGKYLVEQNITKKSR